MSVWEIIGLVWLAGWWSAYAILLRTMWLPDLVTKYGSKDRVPFNDIAEVCFVGYFVTLVFWWAFFIVLIRERLLVRGAQ